MDKSRLFSKVKNIQLISTRLVESLLAGDYRSVFKGLGMEFDEVREYVYGDDARLIDWNVCSRMGSPYTKTFREERELVLYLIVDVSASIFSGSQAASKQEIVSMLFALLAFAAVSNNDRVGAVFFSDTIEHWVPPRKGKKHALRLVQDMLSHEAVGKGSNLSLALRAASEAMKRRGICIILSDFKTSGYWNELSILGRKHDVIAVRIDDPVDRVYPRIGFIQLEDPETGKAIYGLGMSRRFRKHYENFWELQRLNWKKGCERRGVDTLEILTNEDPVQVLLQFFERRRSK